MTSDAPLGHGYKFFIAAVGFIASAAFCAFALAQLTSWHPANASQNHEMQGFAGKITPSVADLFEWELFRSSRYNALLSGHDADEFKQTLIAVEKKRKLEAKEPILIYVISPDELRSYSRNAVTDEWNTFNVLDKQGAVYKFLGLVPRELDYSGFLEDYYSYSVASFYQPFNNDIVLLLNRRGNLKTIAHEYTHALQYQNFAMRWRSIESYQALDLDRYMAIRAIEEGDATYIEDHSNIIESNGVNRPEMELLMGPVAAPDSYPYLDMLHAWPYTAGREWSRQAYAKGHEAVNHAFRVAEGLRSRHIMERDIPEKPVRDRIGNFSSDTITARLGPAVLDIMLEAHGADRELRDIVRKHLLDDRLVLGHENFEPTTAAMCLRFKTRKQAQAVLKGLLEFGIAANGNGDGTVNYSSVSGELVLIGLNFPDAAAMTTQFTFIREELR
ncbi:MAG: hypothetical protein U5N86_01200 [Planctomycetota bacterium]|nr:hypothetical protein [Planctomycetota bacterium]